VRYGHVQAGYGHWAAWGRLDEVIRAGRPQAEVALGSSLWAYFATAAGAREGQAFSQAMGGFTGMLMLDAARLIDTGSVEFALDVGGASGALIHALMKQNPALRGAVQDLPENSAEAAKAAEALQERLSIISGDFFVKCQRRTYTCLNTSYTTGKMTSAFRSCATAGALAEWSGSADRDRRARPRPAALCHPG
jgi:hypothetical protein